MAALNALKHNRYSLPWRHQHLVILLTFRKENGQLKNQFLLRFCERNIAMLKFIFVLLSIFRFSHSAPIDTLSLVSDNFDNENYDIIIDQRQNGTQNFRIKVSGFNIVIPDDREQPQQTAQSTSIEQFASLLSPTTSDNNNQFNGNLDDFADLAAFFDWKKKSGTKKSSDDTQSRTKDIPTDSQLVGDSNAKVKDIVKEENRRYKLLVGEKYIAPILRFLKKQTEDVKE